MLLTLNTLLLSWLSHANELQNDSKQKWLLGKKKKKICINMSKRGSEIRHWAKTNVTDTVHTTKHLQTLQSSLDISRPHRFQIMTRKLPEQVMSARALSRHVAPLKKGTNVSKTSQSRQLSEKWVTCCHQSSFQQSQQTPPIRFMQTLKL